MIAVAAIAAAPSPSPSPLITIAHTRTLGSLPFGAQQVHPVIDANSIEALKQLGVHATLVITVGDDGEFKGVEIRPHLDQQSESRIEEILEKAYWDPAVCGGGIACEGSTAITI